MKLKDKFVSKVIISIHFRKLRILILALSLVALSGGIAGAQVAPDISDPGLELERELGRERRNEDRDRFERTDGLDVPKATVAPPELEQGPCVDIEDVDVEGMTNLTLSEFRDLVDAYVPGCIGQTDISTIMQSIDKAYVDKGYITTRTYIPRQNIQETKRLRLRVLEGFVEQIELEHDGETVTGLAGDILLGTAYPYGTPGEFQLRQLEQAVDQLSRPQSVKAKLKLEPGESPGGSRIVISRNVNDRFRGIVGVNNYGSEATGAQQLRLSLIADGVLSASDVLGITYQGGENSNALSVSGSVPFGNNTFSLTASYSDYAIGLTDISELFGESQSFGFSWDRLTARNSSSKSRVTASLQHRLSNRFINGLQLAPQNSTVFDIRMSKVTDTADARWAWDLGPALGLSLFNVSHDQQLDRTDPHNQFVVLRGGVSWAGKRKTMGRWSSEVRGQIGPHGLYGSEQIALGARSVTRGYEQTTFSGDAAVYGRLNGELELPNGPDGFWGDQYRAQKGRFSPFVFADAGSAYAYAGNRYDWSAGIGGGMRVKVGNASLNFAVEKSLVSDGSFEPFRGDVLARVGLSAKVF